MNDEKKVKGKKIIISNFIWTLNELCLFKKKYIVFMGIDSVVKGISPMISLLLMQQLIDIIQFKSGEVSEIVIKLACLSVFQLISEIVLNYTQLKLENYDLEFDAHFQTKILKKISLLDSKDFENSKTYDLINRTQYDGNMGILGNIKIAFSIVSLLISTVSYTVVLLNYNFLLFILIIVLPSIRYFFEKKYNLLEYVTEKNNTENNRKTDYISFLLTDSENFKEIKMFGLFQFFINRYKKIKSKCNSSFIILHNKRTKVYSILSLFEHFLDFMVTLKILVQTFQGELSIGEFILYSSSIDSLKENIVSLFSQVSFLYKNSAMIEMIREFFDIPSEDIHNNGIPVSEIKIINLKNICYRYQNTEEYTIKNISLELKQGDFTIFMGYNGSGKSTLMKIIMGIYSDYEGDIYVNGVNLKMLNLEQYRQRIGVLFQNYIKYESSISDNICYADLEMTKDDERIKKILEKVRLDEFTANTSQLLGYQFSRGIQISIGQWQKLALGRTLNKKADLFIFDEPNASLDIVSEGVVLNTLYGEMQDKISILIMHRFNNMVDKADKIFVLDKGKLLESGRHKELLNNKLLYYKLYTMQRESESIDDTNDN